MADTLDFRRSDNIEDRRKEMFRSNPQTPQMPNVFADNSGLLNLGRDDFSPALRPNPLSKAAGAEMLDEIIQKYLSDRSQPMVADNSTRLFDLFK